ncbi:hypothetical protein Mal15_19920 [Stieleria maiorica]|uniref:Uncharacterized protein n=1 Tax=Stieleria maiorica TaxID=2795974 RepID=A0A5B9MCJ7_9BACT|nr:hypothetical protein [Stieleria maiorica]QEF97946.1 hypothetical protein Mal15_19920 [Stieleria maiorica]
MFVSFFLLIVLGIYLGILVVVIVSAVSAKSTAGRVAAIVAGLFLLIIVPLFLLAATYSVRVASSEHHVWADQHAAGTRVPDRPLDSTSVDVPSIPTGESASAAPSPPQRPVPPPVLKPVDQTSDEDSLQPNTSSQQQPAGTWRATDTATFTANVYPSDASAIDALLSGLKEKLAENRVLLRDDQNDSNDVVDPDKVVVSADGPDLDSLLPAAISRLGTQFSAIGVGTRPGNAPTKPIENELAIHFSVSKSTLMQAPWDQQDQLQSRLLTCTATMGGRQASFQAFVTEKPWVESFDQFVSRYPQRKFVVGYSGEFQSTEGQARKAALEDAVRQAAFSFRGKSYAIIDDRHVVDRFAQRLSRSYGDVWREAVLVEVPDAQQVDVARTTAAEAFERSQIGRLLQIFGVVVLVLATIVLCLGLNWVTEGYYRSQVMLGLAGVVVMGGLIVAMFLG